LLEHNVPYASNAKKADLIAAFLDGVYAQRTKLLKSSTKTTKASGRGIVLVPTPSVADSESVVDSESVRSESPVRSFARMGTRCFLGADSRSLACSDGAASSSGAQEGRPTQEPQPQVARRA
jgi:hypothetical protein